MWHRTLMVVAGTLLLISAAMGAELRVGDSLLRPGGTGLVTVSGSIDMEETYGVTVMIELVPRATAQGTLEFTSVRVAAPMQRAGVTVEPDVGEYGRVRVSIAKRVDVDVRQPGDPWPEIGSFTAYDTDHTESTTLNGSVDDNGSFVPSAVSYDGRLSAFPISASGNAEGVWDVYLSTSAGDSSWEGVATDLFAGTVTVSRTACSRDRDCRDKDPCTTDSCSAGVCQHVQVSGDCKSTPQGSEGRKTRTQRSRSQNGGR